MSSAIRYGEAILSYESGMLTIQISGVVARAEAEGEWLGDARVPGKLLANLWKSVPPGDPVELSVKKTDCISDRCRSPASGKKKLPPESFYLWMRHFQLSSSQQ